MNTQGYICDLLARGTTQEMAAQLAQVSAGYVSQLLAQEAFAAAVEQKRAGFLIERNERNQRVQDIHDDYLRLEKLTVSTLERDLSIMRPGERVKLLQVLGSKREPMAPLVDPRAAAGMPALAVTVNLPKQIAAQFVLNSNREVIGMDDGKIFAPLSTKALVAEAKAQEVEEAVARAAAIPAPKVRAPAIPSSADIMSLFSGALAETVQI